MTTRTPHATPMTAPLALVAACGLAACGVTGCSSSNAAPDGSTSDGATPDHGAQVDHGASGSDGGPESGCDAPGLLWRSGNKTNYTSYPEPGSPECVEFNGCMWEGLFAGCDGKQTEAWVAAHDIAAVFPGYNQLAGHQLCLRSGARRMVVYVLDTCADSDCSGCCTENQGSADALIDLESYTDARWGLPDGPIEWADLGAAPSPCE